MKPPKERRGCYTAPKTNGLRRIYHFPLFLQRETVLRQRNGQVKHYGFFHREKRRCVCCGKRISNRSLGGFDCKSAMGGRLWCLRCADLPPQLLLPLGGER